MVQKNVTVSVGEVGTVDFNLTVAKAAATAEVTAESPAIDTIQWMEATAGTMPAVSLRESLIQSTRLACRPLIQDADKLSLRWRYQN